MADYSLVRLSRKYDVSQFDCGIEDLNDFLKNDACKNQDDWISKTWLLYEGNSHLHISYCTCVCWYLVAHLG